MKLRRLFLYTFVPLFLTAGLAWAQEEEDLFVEEITVTATKREQSLQDVPIAVTAITSLQIERAGMLDIRDLPTLASSFNMNSSQTESQGTTLRIRGVGTTGNNIGLESSVGVFLDGIYLSRPGIALGDQLDVESIEVLRGPQGTLFGRNVSAGALNLRTRRPSLTDQSGFLNLTAGNFNPFDQKGLSAELNYNLTDNVSLTYLGSWRDFLASSIQDDFVGIGVYGVSPEAANGFETFDDIESWTQEFRLTGDTERVSWLVGGFASGEDILEHVGLGLLGDFSSFVDAILWNYALAPALAPPPATPAVLRPC
ncbi:MAG: TonB-dependent receptor plug domain-containing protein [Acidobacteria bacterium]|nr:TonB-dependent receptor plug domain-containing protein [Acidobacteriota bacterium]